MINIQKELGIVFKKPLRETINANTCQKVRNIKWKTACILIKVDQLFAHLPLFPLTLSLDQFVNKLVWRKAFGVYVTLQKEFLNNIDK